MRHELLDNRPALHRVYTELVRAPDHTMDLVTLSNASQVDRSNLTKHCTALAEAGLVRRHDTSTRHVIWSLTQQGIDLARARGLLEGAGPTAPAHAEEEGDDEPIGVMLAKRLVEIERTIAPLNEERKRILDRLSS